MYFLGVFFLLPCVIVSHHFTPRVHFSSCCQFICAPLIHLPILPFEHWSSVLHQTIQATQSCVYQCLRFSSFSPCQALSSSSSPSVCYPPPSSVNLLHSLWQQYVCLALTCCSTFLTGRIPSSNRIPALLKSLWTVTSLVWALLLAPNKVLDKTT